MKNRTSLLRAFVAGSALVVLPSFFAAACSPDEQINPAPVDGGMSSSSASSSGEAGKGGVGGIGGAGGNQGGAGGGAGAATSSGGGMAGNGGTGGQSGSSSSSSGGQTGGAGGMGSSSTGSSSSSSSSSGAGGSGGMANMDAGPNDAGLCPITTMAAPLEPGIHVAVCSPLTYATNPPTSGPHYPYWAAFKWYTTPVPRGYTIHSLEHGAIVISYNCPNGCTDELGALAAFLDARPADPLCTAPLKARVIVTPDPLIDTKFAAAAWGAFYKGDCFDFAALGAFFDMYYAKAPENFCFDGVDVTTPDAGTPPDCGNVMDAGTD